MGSSFKHDLYEAHPKVYDVLSPQVADTMTAMLEDVVSIGTGIRARALNRPTGGKTGTTQDWTDAWYLGFTPSLTAGVWVGNDDPRISLGRGEQGARTALPIWLEYMKGALDNSPVEQFTGVTPLEKLAGQHPVQVDTPDNAPPEAAPRPATPAPVPTPKPPVTAQPGPGIPHPIR